MYSFKNIEDINNIHRVLDNRKKLFIKKTSVKVMKRMWNSLLEVITKMRIN